MKNTMWYHLCLWLAYLTEVHVLLYLQADILCFAILDPWLRLEYDVLFSDTREDTRTNLYCDLKLKCIYVYYNLVKQKWKEGKNGYKSFELIVNKNGRADFLLLLEYNLNKWMVFILFITREDIERKSVQRKRTACRIT